MVSLFTDLDWHVRPEMNPSHDATAITKNQQIISICNKPALEHSMVPYWCVLAPLWASGEAMMTLSSIEPLPNMSASINCVLTYNTPILGCQINAFMRGMACSDQCRQGLATAQSYIQEACGDLATPKGSLIYEAQNGNLLDALCSGRYKNPLANAPLHTSSTQEVETTIEITISEPTIATKVTVTTATTSELSKTSILITTSSLSTGKTFTAHETTNLTALVTSITIEPPISSSARHTTSNAPTEGTKGPIGGGGGLGSPTYFSSALKIECSLLFLAATVAIVSFV